MKKSIKIAVIAIMLVCAYLLGTTQAETKEVIPAGYIPLNDCIPLADIACYFIDEYDYPCFELKDVATQYNEDHTRSYADIMLQLYDETEERNFLKDL